jgi:hypothetical protein
MPQDRRAIGIFKSLIAAADEWTAAMANGNIFDFQKI